MSEEVKGFFKRSSILDDPKALSPDRIIDPATASSMITRHVKSSTNGHNERVPIVLKTVKGEAIDGFYFHASDIIACLKIDGTVSSDGTGVVTVTSDADGIYVAVGQYTEADKPGANTLIMYPVKNDTTVEVYGRVFDYSEPCPCKCPKGKNGHKCP